MASAAVSDGTASDGAARRPLPGRLGYVLCVTVAAIVLLLDQATKYAALQALTERARIDSFLPLVEWDLVRNPDGAFGLPGFTWMFIAVTVVVLALVIRALPRTDRLSLTVAYGLVCGGALGNVVDRLVREDGAVIDFIKLGAWPTFNVADMAIVCGAVLILVITLAAEREVRRHARAAANHESVRPPGTPAQGQPRDPASAHPPVGGHGHDPGARGGSAGGSR